MTVALHLMIGLRGQLRELCLLEFVLLIYGVTAAVLSVSIGRLLPSDRAWLWCCGLVYFLTLASVVLVPSLN